METIFQQIDIEGDLERVETEDFGSPYFIYNNVNCPCIPGSLSDKAKSDMIGYNDDGNITLLVRTSIFNGVYPIKTESITYKGIIYIISDITKSIDDSIWTLICNIPTAS